jgi:hypothetical protein
MNFCFEKSANNGFYKYLTKMSERTDDIKLFLLVNKAEAVFLVECAPSLNDLGAT